MSKLSSKVSKKSKMIAAVAFVLGATAVGAGVSYADTAKNGPDNHMSDLIDAIAAKFNLSSSDVESVVNDVMAQQREEMEAKAEQAFADRLEKALADGTITEEQADLITAKKDELKSQAGSFLDDFKDMTDEERREELKSRMDELKQWAKDNDIPEEFMMLGGKGHRGPGFGPKPVAPEEN